MPNIFINIPILLEHRSQVAKGVFLGYHLTIESNKLSEFILSLLFQSSLLGVHGGIFISRLRSCPVGSLVLGSITRFCPPRATQCSSQSLLLTLFGPVAGNHSSSSVVGCFQFQLCGGCRFIDFDFPIDCGLLQGKVGITLELSDQKARGFLVPIALKRLFPEHAHKVFGEMSVRR
jgi:hypothetical protein